MNIIADIVNILEDNEIMPKKSILEALNKHKDSVTFTLNRLLRGDNFISSRIIHSAAETLYGLIDDMPENPSDTDLSIRVADILECPLCMGYISIRYIVDKFFVDEFRDAIEQVTSETIEYLLSNRTHMHSEENEDYTNVDRYKVVSAMIRGESPDTETDACIDEIERRHTELLMDTIDTLCSLGDRYAHVIDTKMLTSDGNHYDKDYLRALRNIIKEYTESLYGIGLNSREC